MYYDIKYGTTIQQKGDAKVKSSGMVRKVDRHGRIVLPKDLRQELGWADNTPIEVSQFGRYVLLHKQKDKPSVPIYSTTESPVSQELTELLHQLSDKDTLLVLKLLQRFIAPPELTKNENNTAML